MYVKPKIILIMAPPLINLLVINVAALVIEVDPLAGVEINFKILGKIVTNTMLLDMIIVFRGEDTMAGKVNRVTKITKAVRDKTRRASSKNEVSKFITWK